MYTLDKSIRTIFELNNNKYKIIIDYINLDLGFKGCVLFEMV